MKIKLSLAVALLAIGAALPARADVQFAGTYSNLRYVEQAGDLIGEELTIVPQPDGRFAVLVQCDEGELGTTVFVQASVKGNQISFDVPNTSYCPGHHVGRLTTVKTKRGTETYLTFPEPLTDSDSGPARLKNKRSYWDGD